MAKVLYEIYFQFDFAYLIPIILFAFAIFFPKISGQNQRSVKIFTKIIAIFIGFLILLMAITKISEYSYILSSYSNQKYNVVEGSVENFIPMPHEGHSIESFRISGVEFEYSDFELIAGYNRTITYGGVIKGDGQFLKIKYVPYNGENRIVYIEEFDNNN